MTQLHHAARLIASIHRNGHILCAEAEPSPPIMQDRTTKEEAGEELPVVARFVVRRRAYLSPTGSPLRKLPAFASDSSLLVALYRAMVLARAFDLKAVSLQRTGRLGTYAVALGQEAVAAGVASAMREEDVLLPSYRDNARSSGAA
jgi:pyruvate dehydrogenase E1 component alpha subunit